MQPGDEILVVGDFLLELVVERPEVGNATEIVGIESTLGVFLQTLRARRQLAVTLGVELGEVDWKSGLGPTLLFRFWHAEHALAMTALLSLSPRALPRDDDASASMEGGLKGRNVSMETRYGGWEANVYILGKGYAVHRL